MKTPYDYKSLISLCDTLLTSESAIEAANLTTSWEEWNNIVEGATISVTEKLFSLQDNTQRIGFIAHILESIFNPLACIYLKLGHRLMDDGERETIAKSIILKKNESFIDSFFLNVNVFEYATKLSCMLPGFVCKLSEDAYLYNMNADLLINKYLNCGEIEEYYIYKTSDGGYKEPGYISKFNDATISVSLQESSLAVSSGVLKGKKPQTFSDLFSPEYQYHIDMFVQILKEVDKPLINDRLEWIGPASAAVLFFEALHIKGVLLPSVKKTPCAKMFADKFLNLKESSFIKRPPKGSPILDYKNEFLHSIESVMSEIKAITQ